MKRKKCLCGNAAVIFLFACSLLLFSACGASDPQGDTRVEHIISVQPLPAEGTISSSHTRAVAGTEVEVTFEPIGERRLQNLWVVGDTIWIAVAGSGNIRTFTMPDENVEIRLQTESTTVGTFNIALTQPSGGSIASSHTTASQGTLVTITAVPDAGQRLRGVAVSGGTPVPAIFGSGNVRQFYTPNVDVTVTAEFESTTVPVFNIGVHQSNGGIIRSSHTTASPGTLITLSGFPHADHRFGGVAITGAAVTVNEIPREEHIRQFIMPSANISVTAQFPSTLGEFTITVNQSTGGSVEVSHVRAFPGTQILMDINTLAGYQLIGFNITGFNVLTMGSGTRWHFLMPPANIEISAEFKELPEGVVYYIYSGDRLMAFANWGWGGFTWSFNSEPGLSGGYAITATIPAGSETWAGGSLVLMDEVNFNDFDAISFWIRSPEGAVAAQISFGTDDEDFMLRGVRYRGENNNGVVIGTEWQNIIIPMPRRMNATTSEFFWINGTGLIGTTLHIDDVRLITANINRSLEIPNLNIYMSPPTPFTQFTNDKRIVNTFVDKNNKVVSLFSDSFVFDTWFAPPSFVVGGSATANAANTAIVPNAGAGGQTYSLTVSFGGMTATATGTILDAVMTVMVLEDFNRSGGFDDHAGYWAWPGPAVFGVVDTRNAASFPYSAVNHSIGTYGRNWDISMFETVSFWFRAPDTTHAFSFGLDTHPPGTPIGSEVIWRTPNFNVSQPDTWQQFTFDLDDLFLTSDSSILFDKDIFNITGWRFVAHSGTGTAHISTIQVEQ